MKTSTDHFKTLLNTAMQNAQWLGETVDLQSLLDSRKPETVKGYLKWSQFPRLLEAIPQDVEVNSVRLDQQMASRLFVMVALKFFRDDQQNIRMEGLLRWQMPVICQRCLEDFEQNFQITVASVILPDDQVKAPSSVVITSELKAASSEQMVEYHDYVTVASLSPTWGELLEDDLLLGLPLVHMHPEGDLECQKKARLQQATADQSLKPSRAIVSNLHCEQGQPKQRPFAVLSELYQKN